MFNIWSGISRVGEAFHALADSITSLSDTFRQANGVVRERFNLDGEPVPAPETVALPAPAEGPAQVPFSRKSKRP